jgi:flagellar hook assembly protein FlgD
VSIYDVSGRLINTLKNSNVLPGSYKIKWMGNDLKGHSMPTGVYFLQVHSGVNINSQKVLLIK